MLKVSRKFGYRKNFSFLCNGEELLLPPSKHCNNLTEIKSSGSVFFAVPLAAEKYFFVLTFFMRKYFAMSEKSCIFAIEIEKEYKRKQRTSYENID
jgi:hypothetical protein